MSTTLYEFKDVNIHENNKNIIHVFTDKFDCNRTEDFTTFINSNNNIVSLDITEISSYSTSFREHVILNFKNKSIICFTCKDYSFLSQNLFISNDHIPEKNILKWGTVDIFIPYFRSKKLKRNNILKNMLKKKMRKMFFR